MKKTTYPARYRELSLWITGGFVSVLAGVVASTGDPRLVLLFAGTFAGLLASLSPLPLFWAGIVVSFVLAGLAQLYYPPLELIRWAILPISAMLVVHVLIQQVQMSRARPGSDKMPLIFWLLVAFILVNILSAIMNAEKLSTLVTGMKGYFQTWGLVFAMALIDWKDELMRKQLPKAIWLLALIQLPFVLHQYFFVVPGRHGIVRGIVPLDIVSGTFGGSVEGGGANAALAAYMLVVWSCVLALWKNSVLSTARTLFASAIVLAPVMINEAKVSVVYVVVVFMVIFRRGIFQNLTRFIGVGILTAAIVATLFVAYIRQAPEGKVANWSDLITYTIAYNTADSESEDGKLSRGGAIKLWLDDHGSLANTLLGYGVGASRSDEHNYLAQKLGISDPLSFDVGNLAAIAILWESGVIGFAIVTALFAVAFRDARKLEKHYWNDKRQSAIFLGLQGAIAVLYISLWHKNFFVFHIGYQAIVVVLLGYLVFWLRQSGTHRITDRMGTS